MARAAHQERHLPAGLGRVVVGPEGVDHIRHMSFDEGLPVGGLTVGVADGVSRVREGGRDDRDVLQRRVGEQRRQRRPGRLRLGGPAGDVDVPVDAVPPPHPGQGQAEQG